MGLQSVLSSTDLSAPWLDMAFANAVARMVALRRRLMQQVGAKAATIMLAIKAEAATGAVATTWTTSDDLLARFQRFVVPELDAAYNFARFLSRDADAAQDIVQNAFLRAYRGFENYRGGDIRAWILSIVRNCYHDWLSERRRRAGIEVDTHRHGEADDGADDGIEDVPSEEDTPEVALMRKTETDSVRQVLTGLPRALREVLVLREIEGFSYRQIADIACVPIGTVMSRLARARKEFGDAWQREMNAQETTS